MSDHSVNSSLLSLAQPRSRSAWSTKHELHWYFLSLRQWPLTCISLNSYDRQLNYCLTKICWLFDSCLVEAGNLKWWRPVNKTLDHILDLNGGHYTRTWLRQHIAISNTHTRRLKLWIYPSRAMWPGLPITAVSRARRGLVLTHINYSDAISCILKWISRLNIQCPYPNPAIFCRKRSLYITTSGCDQARTEKYPQLAYEKVPK